MMDVSAPDVSSTSAVLADTAPSALYEQALTREPDNAQAKLNRAVLHLLNGNLKDGWRDYEARLALTQKAPRPDRALSRLLKEDWPRSLDELEAKRGA